MKQKGKKYWFCALALAAIFAFSACTQAAEPFERVSAEYGESYDITALLKGEELLPEIKLTDPFGEEVSVGNGVVVPEALGEWLLTHADGTVSAIDVSDTKGPAITVLGLKGEIERGENVEIPVPRIVDRAEGEIEEYGVNVLFEGAEIAAENGMFTAAKSGVYTIRYTAEDGKKNVSVKEFTVNSVAKKDVQIADDGIKVDIYDVFDRALEPETDLSADGAAALAEEKFDIRYTVVKLSGTERTVLCDDVPYAEIPELTTDAVTLYEVSAVAVNRQNEEDIRYGYATYASEDVISMTFNDDGMTGAKSFYANISLGGENGNTEVIYDASSAREGYYSELILTPPDYAEVPYDVYFDLHCVGKTHTEGEWIVQLGWNEGEIVTCSSQITRHKMRLSPHPTDGNGLWALFTVYGEKFKAGCRLVFDNFVFAPVAEPVLTLNAEAVALPDLSKEITLDAETLGIAVSEDVFGNPLTPSISSVSYFNGSVTLDKTEEMPFGKTFSANKLAEGQYTVTLSLKDKWGNTTSKSVVLQCGTSDFIAPVIERASGEISLAAGSTVTLSEEGLGLTVEESGEYTLSYRVYKTLGGGTAAREEMQVSDSFAVEAGYFYEIYITATDESGNEGKSYVLAKDENLMMLSFENDPDLAEIFANSYNFVYTAETDEWGNTRLVWNVEISGRYETDIVIDLAELSTGEGTVYFTYETQGNDATEWLMQTGEGTGTIIVMGDSGRESSVTIEHTGYEGAQIWWRFTVNPGQLMGKDMRMVFDNIVIVSAQN